MTNVKSNGTIENRQSFMKRFRLKITPEEMSRLDFAYDMAKYGHREQSRESGVRYFEHLRETALILVDELGITDIDLVIAALLHDMLEDNFLLDQDRISLTFGKRVAYIVSVVTKPKKADKRFASDAARPQWYFEQIFSASVDAKIVKLADRLQNMRTLEFCAPAKQARKAEETKKIYYPLLDDITKAYPEVAEYFRTQLREALERFLVPKPQ